MFRITPIPFMVLKRVGIGLARADAYGLVDRVDEDLAIADLAGLGGRSDCLDYLVGEIRRHRDLDLDLGQEADGVFGAAIDFGMPFLAAVTFDLGNRHALD